MLNGCSKCWFIGYCLIDSFVGLASSFHKTSWLDFWWVLSFSFFWWFLFSWFLFFSLLVLFYHQTSFFDKWISFNSLFPTLSIHWMFLPSPSWRERQRETERDRERQRESERDEESHIETETKTRHKQKETQTHTQYTDIETVSGWIVDISWHR